MMSLIGVASLPVLILSLVYIFFHSKFIRLFNAYNNSRNLLNELSAHKLELLLYFAQDLPESQIFFSDENELFGNIKSLEEQLAICELSKDDILELGDITKEIEDSQIMYSQAKEDFERFARKFPGKLFATFFVCKSS